MVGLWRCLLGDALSNVTLTSKSFAFTMRLLRRDDLQRSYQRATDVRSPIWLDGWRRQHVTWRRSGNCALGVFRERERETLAVGAIRSQRDSAHSEDDYFHQQSVVPPIDNTAKKHAVLTNSDHLIHFSLFVLVRAPQSFRRMPWFWRPTMENAGGNTQRTQPADSDLPQPMPESNMPREELAGHRIFRKMSRCFRKVSEASCCEKPLESSGLEPYGTESPSWSNFFFHTRQLYWQYAKTQRTQTIDAHPILKIQINK